MAAHYIIQKLTYCTSGIVVASGSKTYYVSGIVVAPGSKTYCVSGTVVAPGSKTYCVSGIDVAPGSKTYCVSGIVVTPGSKTYCISRYKAIFPDGRKPFRRGSVDQRINAYSTLGMNIGSDDALATIKTQVDNTYELLDETREDQQGAKSNVKGGSSQLDAARIAAMNMQYRNLGFIMDTFFDTREAECAALFDLETLRESEQTSFTVTLDPEENEAVLIHTFLSTDELKCRIDTTGPISLYLASSPCGTDSTAVVLDSLTETIIPITAFGELNLSTHRYLTAVSAAEEVTKLRVVLE